MRNGKVFAIWAEFNVVDLFVEVEVMEDYLSGIIHQQCSSIYQNIAGLVWMMFTTGTCNLDLTFIHSDQYSSLR